MDGINISKDNYRDYLSEISAEAREHTVELAKTKRDRIDYFLDNTIICYVADKNKTTILFYILSYVHNPVRKA